MPPSGGIAFMPTDATDPAPKTWRVVLSALLSAFLLLAALGLALLGGASYNDSYSHEADRAWGVASLATGGLLFAASCLALAFVFARRQAVRLPALAAHGLAL